MIRLIRREQIAVTELTDTQKVFLMSKANGADYQGDALPHHRRIWPKGFLERRLEQIRREAR